MSASFEEIGENRPVLPRCFPPLGSKGSCFFAVFAGILGSTRDQSELRHLWATVVGVANSSLTRVSSPARILTFSVLVTVRPLRTTSAVKL